MGFEPTINNLTTPWPPQVSGTIGLGDSAPCLITLLTWTGFFSISLRLARFRPKFSWSLSNLVAGPRFELGILAYETKRMPISTSRDLESINQRTYVGIVLLNFDFGLLIVQEFAGSSDLDSRCSSHFEK